MAQAYYYFAASLPLLQFEAKLPMTVEEYLSDCQRLLEAEDYHFVKEFMFVDQRISETEDVSYKALLERRDVFFNMLSAFRAKRAGKDVQDYVRGSLYSDAYLQEIIQQASKMGDLLEAEQLLARTSWKFLDFLSADHFNDAVFFGVYGLQLQILARFDEINSSKGREIFEEYKEIGVSKEEVAEVLA